MEYRIKYDLDEEQLNDMGLQGWDNYAVLQTHRGVMFFFKRKRIFEM